MSDIITPTDTETWHDQRPSHPMLPDAVYNARVASDEAWCAYDNIVTEEHDGDPTGLHEPNYQRITDALDAALAANEVYYAACRATSNV
jgi:hypothetical protein